jgi:hypothetical protein
MSGRDWVQRLRTVMNITISVQLFFAALRSKRRRRLVEDVAENVCRQANSLILNASDPLAGYTELSKYACYALDGHIHGASAHENQIRGKKRPVGHIFALNLRTHTLKSVALSTPQGAKKKEHEISTLKRLSHDKLRMGEPTGIKNIIVYDPAIIDYIQWYKWKKHSGIYIITIEKKNSALTKLGNNQWDRVDSRNNGVIADEFVGPSNGHLMRRVTYIDPVTGKEYRFITNEFNLSPGMIAFLYKLRWDVEKVFDQIKNKMHEKKAWAANKEAKRQQAAFIATAHNLMRMLETNLEIEEGITDEISAKKRRKRLKNDIAKAKSFARQPNALVVNCSRVTQRCLQFIRWLIARLENHSPYGAAIECLRPLMTNYL